MNRANSRFIRSTFSQSLGPMTDSILKEYKANRHKLHEKYPMWDIIVAIISQNTGLSEINPNVYVPTMHALLLEREDFNPLQYHTDIFNLDTSYAAYCMAFTEDEEAYSKSFNSTIGAVALTYLVRNHISDNTKIGNAVTISCVIASTLQIAKFNRAKECIKTVGDLINYSRLYFCNRLLSKRNRNAEIGSFSTLEDFLDSIPRELPRDQYEAYLRFVKSDQCSDQLAQEIMGGKFSESKLKDAFIVINETTFSVSSVFFAMDYRDLKEERGQQTTELESKLQISERKIAKQKSTIEELRNKIKDLEQKLSVKPKVDNTIVEQYELCKKETIKLQNKVLKLQSRIESLTNAEEEVTEEPQEVVTEIVEEPVEPVEEVTLEQKVDFINDYNIVIIGGPTNFSNKIKQFLPKARVIDKNTKYNEIIVGKADAVFIYYKIVGHSRVAKIESQIKDGKAKSYYISSTNKERFCEEVYQLLSKQQVEV